MRTDDEFPVPAGTELNLAGIDLLASIVFLPIRHHSPGCAWHVGRWIEDHQPAAVLIEGPADANSLIPEIVDSATVPPVAFYSFVRGNEERSGHACWYPFCEYSPEYVALTKGKEVGAEVAFIDLPTWWHASILAGGTSGPAVTNVYGDHQLRHHNFIAELCRRAHCRDFDDLWDHLFESSGFVREPETFWSDVATYCQIARLHSNPASFDPDGTNVREAYMAARIQEAVKRHRGRKILVVTGGFHRGGLLDRLQGPESDPVAPPKPKGGEHGCYLTAYGDQQLDRWSGYESGMPTPNFYRFLWALGKEKAEPEVAVASLLSELRRHLHRSGEEVSTAEVIAAERLLLGLARFRGHAAPTREDVRDAIRSTWIKGAMDEAHGFLLKVVDQYLVGTTVGRVSPTAGLPPIVRDFEAQLKEHRLPGKGTKDTARRSATATRQINLDIHGRTGHRRRSAFLHRLRELGIPYATLVVGPDFVAKTDLERVREIWQVRWEPAVEGMLIERAMFGVTIAEAAENHLLDRYRRSGSLGAAVAVEILTTALVMALPAIADELSDAIEHRLAQEGEFTNAADALSGLVSLLAYRAVLNAGRYPVIEGLARKAYSRAVWLLDTLPGIANHPADRQAERTLSSLSRLRHVVLAETLPGIDANLFTDALERVSNRLGRLPLLEGAVLGILRQGGGIDDDRIRSAVKASIDNTAAGLDLPLGEFLRGLFSMIRHAVVERTGLLELVHECIAMLPEERFRAMLPSLRLAFTHFSPREIRQIATTIESWTRDKGSETQSGEKEIEQGESLPGVEARVAEAWQRLRL